MAEVVLDASAVLAMLLGETGGTLVSALLLSFEDAVWISSVNVYEIEVRLIRHGFTPRDMALMIEPLRTSVFNFDLEQADVAAELYRSTGRTGLSLGDRACLALAQVRGAEAWTCDQAWNSLGVGPNIKLIR